MLEDKVIVITGGAMGIGASLVELLHSAGAHVFFGDVESVSGEALANRISSSSKSSQKLQFVKTNVADYASNLNLFETAFNACGRVDHAVSAAGIGEIGNIVSRALTLESVKEPPPMKVIDVNLIGPIYFARIASVYLRQGQSSNTSKLTDRSLALVSSVAGLFESPGLFVYGASKHGVIGLMRSLRRYFPTYEQPIRTNCICPWMTKTRLVSGIEEEWEAEGLPTNSPMDVAKIIAGALATPTLNGAALYVEGGRGWELESVMESGRPQWMGEKQAREFDRGQEVLGIGDGWTKK